MTANLLLLVYTIRIIQRTYRIESVVILLWVCTTLCIAIHINAHHACWYFAVGFVFAFVVAIGLSSTSLLQIYIVCWLNTHELKTNCSTSKRMWCKTNWKPLSLKIYRTILYSIKPSAWDFPLSLFSLSLSPTTPFFFYPFFRSLSRISFSLVSFYLSLCVFFSI